MIVPNSVVIQQKAKSVTRSGCGLLLSGSNYILTSPVWLIHGSVRGKDAVFSVSFQSAGNTIDKRDAILVRIVPIPKAVAILQKLVQDVSLPDAKTVNNTLMLCSIIVLQMKGTPLHCR